MIFFATPCYRSDPYLATRWYDRTARELNLRGSVQKLQIGCPWLHVARALLVKKFLASSCSVLMFRDDDVIPTSEIVLRMWRRLATGVDAVVAPYVIRDGERFDVVVDSRSGEVRFAGLGCTMLARHVLEDLVVRYREELAFRQGDLEAVALFRDFFAERDDGVELLKEDHAFWWRVRDAGYVISALDDVEVLHAGATRRYRAPAAAAATGEAKS